MRQDGIEPEMPPQSAPHIVGYLMEVGPAEAAGMGVAPVSWQAIDAWQRRTAIVLPPWQALLLRRLSAEYVAESRRAEKPDCPPPWLRPGTAESRAAVDAKIRAFFGSFGKGGDDG